MVLAPSAEPCVPKPAPFGARQLRVAEWKGIRRSMKFNRLPGLKALLVCLFCLQTWAQSNPPQPAPAKPKQPAAQPSPGGAKPASQNPFENVPVGQGPTPPAPPP